ncbi:MAG TPA: DUF2784 domain-containing protein [Terriglobales bacterium]|nr:DUF2784 domain-containing protein [Terriglobales bacterium]
MFQAAAIFVLILHLGFILWVILGALFTRGRPLLTLLHVASVLWGLVIEIFPWTCPLTYVENWLNVRAGIAPYQRGFLLHYLDALIYPDVPAGLLTAAAVVVVAANAAIYWKRWRRSGA